MKSKDYWFKRRRYGWGWIPVTWQGWVVVLGYLAVVLGVLSILSDLTESRREFPAEGWFGLLFLGLATIALVCIGYKKGPKPKWRWGHKSSDKPGEDW